MATPSAGERRDGQPETGGGYIFFLFFHHILEWTWALLLSKHVLGSKQTDLDDAQARNREEILLVPS